MSQWDADAPGTTKAWWIERRGCIPKGHHERFNEFTHRLHEYNLNPVAANLADLEVCVRQLIEELGGRRKPVVTSALGRFAYKRLTQREMKKKGVDPGGEVQVPLVPPIDTSAPGARARVLRHRIGEVLDRPALQSDHGFKRDTENVETALHNLLQTLGVAPPPPPAPGIPSQYDV
jgi:hypothetical protein